MRTFFSKKAKWFVVERGLSDFFRDRLNKAGIEYLENFSVVDKNGNERVGTRFLSSQEKEVLSALSVKKKNLADTPILTQNPDVVVAEFKDVYLSATFVESSLDVNIDFNDMFWMFEWLAKTIMSDVVIKVWGKKNLPASTSQEMNIVLLNNRQYINPKRFDYIFGLSTSHVVWGGHLITSSPINNQDRVILTTEGYPIAEFHGNNIIILSDIWLLHTEDIEEVLYRIIREVVKVYLPAPLAKEKVRELDKGFRNNLISRYAFDLSDRFIGISKVLQEKKSSEITLADKKRRISLSVEEMRKLLSSFKKISSEDVLAKEFDAILSHASVEKVVFFNDKLTVFTKNIVTIKITDDGFRRDMGCFRIEIQTDGNHDCEDGGIRMFNLTRKIGGSNFPHESESGIPCLGNISNSVRKYYDNMEYSALVMLLIEFLRRPDPHETYGVAIFDWPIYDEKLENPES